MLYDAVKQMTFFVNYGGDIRKFFTIGFTKKDASFYLFPYAAGGHYDFGSTEMPESVNKHTFDFTKESNADEVPKVSIHESGQVHAATSAHRAGPLMIPPLGEIGGLHVATVTADRFDALPVCAGAIKHGRKAHHVFDVDPGVQSGRMPIFLWTDERHEVADCAVRVRMLRASLLKPLYVGLKLRAQTPLGGRDKPGVTLIAGWNPGHVKEKRSSPYLYVRGT